MKLWLFLMLLLVAVNMTAVAVTAPGLFLNGVALVFCGMTLGRILERWRAEKK
jgi:hypothetical protein